MALPQQEKGGAIHQRLCIFNEIGPVRNTIKDNRIQALKKLRITKRKTLE